MRYLAMTKRGKPIIFGKKLGDVQSLGERIIVDFKQRRYSFQGLYPINYMSWYYDFNNLGNIIRKN